MPYLATSEELKTKPTQHSVAELRSRGIMPQVIVVRSDRPLDDPARRKISLFCDVEPDAVINAMDVPNIYGVPLALREAGMDSVVCRHLGLESDEPDLTDWGHMVARGDATTDTVVVGLVGKYIDLPDAYLSVVEALAHGGLANDVSVDVRWIPADDVDGLLAASYLEGVHGILVPGGFGIRGIEGKIQSARHAREERIPYLGLCLGLQCAVIEYARNVIGYAEAHSSEFDPVSPHPVIDLMEDQVEVEEKGGTMRLGIYPAKLAEGSLASRLYGEEVIYERHRHRWEVNNRYRTDLQKGGLSLSGISR